MAGVTDCRECRSPFGGNASDCCVGAMLAHVRSEVARLKRAGPAASGIAHTLSVILKQLEKIAEANEP